MPVLHLNSKWRSNNKRFSFNVKEGISHPLLHIQLFLLKITAMICGVKIPIPDEIIKRHLKELADYKSTYQRHNKRTGALIQTSTYTFQGLDLKYRENFPVILHGSLHKFWNNGVHNYDDFSYSALCKTIERMERELKINPSTAILQNLEFGVNITTLTPASELINNIVAKGIFKRHDIVSEDNLNGYAEGINFKTQSKNGNCSQYGFKIYHKGIQYWLPVELLRLEHSANKMQCLHRAGIKYLIDLTNMDKLRLLGDILIEQVQDLIIIEDVDLNLLTKAEQKTYLHSQNPLNWSLNWNANVRDKRKRELKKIHNKYSTTDRKAEILNLVMSKLNKLLPASCF